MKDTGIGCACAVVIGRRDAAFIDTQSPLACAAFSAIFCLDTCVSEPLPGGVAAQGGGLGRRTIVYIYIAEMGGAGGRGGRRW